MRRAHWEVDDDDGDDADEGENDDENDDGDEEENDGENDENGDYLDQPSAIHLPLLQNRAPEKYFFRLSSTWVHLSSGMVLCLCLCLCPCLCLCLCLCHCVR